MATPIDGPTDPQSSGLCRAAGRVGPGAGPWAGSGAFGS